MSAIDPVPYPSIEDTAWAMLAEAANDVYHPMRIVTLATVDAKGRPQARSMILRGASRELSRIWFHSDRDSQKVDELRRLPRAAVLAYDPSRSIQMRITGSVALHEDNVLAQDHWHQMNMTLRSVYGSPGESAATGERLPFEDPRLNRLWQHQNSDGLLMDRRRFVVIDVHVEHIDWLQTLGAKQWKSTLPAKRSGKRRGRRA